MAEQKEIIEGISEIHLIYDDIKRLYTNTKKRGANNLTENYLKNKLNDLSLLWTRCQKLHAHISTVVNPETRATVAYFNEKSFERIRDAYDEIETFFQEQLDDIQTSAAVTPKSPLHHSSVTAVSPDISAQIKLPKISLPTFSGDYTQWHSFKDLYKSVVHDNATLSNVQKLVYLKSCLEGEAAHVIAAFSSTNDNYSPAWEALISRFQHERLIFTSLLNKMFRAPDVVGDNLRNLTSLRDTYKVVLDSIESLGHDITNRDTLVVHLLVQKFDKCLKRDWERMLADRLDYPDLADLDKFLLRKIRALEATNMDAAVGRSQPSSITKVHTRNQSHLVTTDSSSERQIKCYCCGGDHTVYRCERFMNLSVHEKYDLVKQKKLCFNCLARSHMTSQCTSPHSCRSCGKRHHTLLHTDNNASLSHTVRVDETSSIPLRQEATPTVVTSLLSSHNHQSVILATALIMVLSPNNDKVVTRALIDPGSQSSFISDSLTQILNLPRQRTAGQVSGLGGKLAENFHIKTELKITSLQSPDFELTIKPFVIPKITKYHPKTLSNVLKSELIHMKLADPLPYRDQKIEVLLGGDSYGALLKSGVLHLGDGNLVAQFTHLGWIITGSSSSATSTSVIHTNHITIENLNHTLTKFWELEDIPSVPASTEDELECEKLFSETHQRDSNGRFMVRLPFKTPLANSKLGDSARKAKRSLDRLLIRLTDTANVSRAYSDFLKEYEDLGHMSRLPFPPPDPVNRVYLPHREVVRENARSTKVRVVFNASCPTSTGVSLNDLLLPGPKLQTDISGVLLNWRLPQFVMIADIEKMFRQILVVPEHRHFQSILWKPDEGETPVTFDLNTVTYGTACAPYLAMRSIKQLAEETKSQFPLAFDPLTRGIYVDDILFGADDLATVDEIRHQLISALSLGCFVLKKWASNSSPLLPRENQIPIELGSNDPGDEPLKVLGLNWNPNSDQFEIYVQDIPDEIASKRTILKPIAKIYDPLGWLSPIVVTAKSLLQSLWLIIVGWDDPLPPDVVNKWRNFLADLPNLRLLKVDRWVKAGADASTMQLIGFSDASNLAYSAAVYLRVVLGTGEVHSSLLMAKSKVAPLKAVSIPRLELCGAQLLVKLIRHILKTVNVSPAHIYCFSDSKIVLAWLRKQPATWQTFVRNRVSFIQSELPEASWFHVRTKDNPADLNSRGLSGSELQSTAKWWRGPEWLSSRELDSSLISPDAVETTEEQCQTNSHTLVSDVDPEHFLSKFSDWSKMLRIVAYVFRFLNRVRQLGSESSPNWLSPSDISEAETFVIRFIQVALYEREMRALERGQSVDRRSPLYRLHPFLDNRGVLRLGGRLVRSTIDSLEKTPMILGKHYLTTLLIRKYHFISLHGGCELTLRLLREKFWIVHGRNQVKAVIHRCVRCVREKATLKTQLMSDLPTERCSPSRHFTHCGVDYAGPYMIRTSSGRGNQSRKGYISVFVCFSTRAIHLELVFDYSTSTFLATFDRFIARRGTPAMMYSDNGTTFQGAAKDLRASLKKHIQDTNVQNKFSSVGINWSPISEAYGKLE